MTLNQHTNSAVLFADLTGSTRLFADIGDAQAQVMVAQYLDTCSRFTRQHGGQVVQLRGDGLLAVFPSVDQAMATAIAIRNSVDIPPLAMHAGINCGPLLLDGDQLYGDVVNMTARLSDIAKRNEIILSVAAQAQLSDAAKLPLRLIKKVSIKGKPEPVDIYLLPDDRQQVTAFRQPAMSRTLKLVLQLHYRDSHVVVGGTLTECVIGRETDCGLQVDHSLASRRHATVESRQGKYFLQDHSTNGTYVREGGTAILVQRETVQLKEHGALSLGIEPSLNAEHLVTFRLVAQEQ